MTYASEVAADAPIYRLTFDQAGSTITDTGSSPRTITQVNSPTKATTPFTTGLSLNGTNQYITAANVYDFGNDVSYSIEVWFKSTQTTGMGTFLRRDSAGADLFRLADGKVDFRHNNGAHATSPLSYADGNWHHAVGVRTGTSTIVLYVDGAQVATGTATSHTMTTSQPTYIGTSAGTDEFFNGIIDELAFYDTALTSTRISAHYTAGRTLVGSIKVTPPVITSNNISMPDAVIRVHKKVTPPAATLSLTTPAVDVVGRYYIVTADRLDGGSGTSGSLAMSNTSGARDSLWAFTLPTAPAGQRVSSLTFRGKSWSGVSQAARDLTAQRITASWTEGGTGIPATDTTETISFTVTPGASSGSPALYSVDLTPFLDNWNGGASQYGVRFHTVENNAFDLVTHEDTTNAPYAVVTFEAIPAGPEQRMTPPAATLSLTMPQHRADTGTRIAAPVATATLTAIAPGVSSSAGINVSAPAFSAGVTFPGGVSKNPDFRAIAGLAEAWLFSPDATQTVRYPTNVTGPAMEVSLTFPGAVGVNLTTNRLSKTTPMTATARMVGIYFKEADRYLKAVGKTVGAEDVWYQLDELSGQVATDAVHNSLVDTFTNDWNSDGVLTGGVRSVDGPYLRKATRFNGTSDWLKMNYLEHAFSDSNVPDTIIDASLRQGRNAQFSLTVEFSIKTTQQNGVVFQGTGAQSTLRFKSSPFNTFGEFPSGSELVLENGELVLVTPGIAVKSNPAGARVKVRKFIADGEWHHVVLSIPVNDQQLAGTNNYAYVAIDGKTVLVRRDTLGNPELLIPNTFMARAAVSTRRVGGDIGPFAMDYDHMNGFLAGDLRDVIVRNDYLPFDTTQKLYYEWSDSMLIQPEPITVGTISAFVPFKAKGNVKKMLAIFGLERKYSIGQASSTFDIYRSTLSGLDLRSVEFPDNAMAGSLSGNIYIERDPFMLEGWLVLPVSIEGAYPRNEEINGTPIEGSTWGAVGADGLLNGEYIDRFGNFVHDETGARRWLDLDKDLAEPVSAFDCITVVNYPWEKPGVGDKFTLDYPYVLTQRSRGMSPDEWTQARDAFRDSLLKALYEDGLNFWIPEYHMAQHLGFIQGYDLHSSGRFRTLGQTESNWHIYNKEAERIDGLHGGTMARGDYKSYPQANFFRRIVATEPGLTDIPSFELGDMIEGYPLDPYDLKYAFVAFDVVDKSNGLVIGDKVKLSLIGEDSGSSVSINDRALIVSAQPQGIVGKVIAREQVDYAKSDTLDRQANQFKDNAITIIAERGSILNGKAIRGRVFMDFMGTDVARGFLPEDLNKNMMGGDSTALGTTWSFDSRRYKTVLIDLIVQKLKFQDNELKLVSIPVTYAQFEDGVYVYRPHYSMTARGLNWLSQASDLAPGQVKAYIPAMEINVTLPNPGFTKTRNVVSSVIGAARLDVEIRDARNFRGNNVREKALPMTLNLEMKGFGKVVHVPAATLTLSMLNTTITAGGDKITVYLEREDTIKLFLKEDN
jgi:hypothetical protein